MDNLPGGLTPGELPGESKSEQEFESWLEKNYKRLWEEYFELCKDDFLEWAWEQYEAIGEV